MLVFVISDSDHLQCYLPVHVVVSMDVYIGQRVGVYGSVCNYVTVRVWMCMGQCVTMSVRVSMGQCITMSQSGCVWVSV